MDIGGMGHGGHGGEGSGAGGTSAGGGLLPLQTAVREVVSSLVGEEGHDEGQNKFEVNKYLLETSSSDGPRPPKGPPPLPRDRRCIDAAHPYLFTCGSGYPNHFSI